MYAGSNSIAVLVESSHESEIVGLVRAGQRLALARLYMALLLGDGDLPTTTIKTDSLTAARVIRRDGVPARSKATARRHYVLGLRVEAGEMKPEFVPDGENPADFLTKWLPTAKLRASHNYATNARVWFGKSALGR